MLHRNEGSGEDVHTTGVAGSNNVSDNRNAVGTMPKKEVHLENGTKACRTTARVGEERHGTNIGTTRTF